MSATRPPADSIIDGLRRELHQTREHLDSICSRAAFALDRAQDEIRAARREAAEMRVEFYTEAEAAEALKVGESTLRRLRKERHLPHVRLGDVRYTNINLAEIAEILGEGVGLEERKGKRSRPRAA